jgi:hypothetical protein
MGASHRKWLDIGCKLGLNGADLMQKDNARG